MGSSASQRAYSAALQFECYGAQTPGIGGEKDIEETIRKKGD